MGLHFRSGGIAVTLAVAFLPTSGCSWLFVNKPPREAVRATPPVECTSSVASPVVDTIAAGLLAFGGVGAIVLASEVTTGTPGYDPLAGMNTVFTAEGVVLIAAAVPLAFSAAHGYSATAACRQLREMQLACVSGVEASCRSLEARKP
jgi:hypothetical protein